MTEGEIKILGRWGWTDEAVAALEAAQRFLSRPLSAPPMRIRPLSVPPTRNVRTRSKRRS